jgi:hypothetical protein
LNNGIIMSIASLSKRNFNVTMNRKNRKVPKVTFSSVTRAYVTHVELCDDCCYAAKIVQVTKDEESRRQIESSAEKITVVNTTKIS